MLASDPAMREEADPIVAAGERALAAARKIVGDLLVEDRPQALDAVAASALAAARGLPLTFSGDGVPADAVPAPETVDALVHVGREAVANAVKHASASSVSVVLEYGDRWHLLVSDDGTGFDTGLPAGGFGLESMRRQVLGLGGALVVRSTPGGTTVEAFLP
jgi:signal transduction histidine kinase